METVTKKSFINRDIMKSSILGAFKKLNPLYMIKNPVMFVVEVGFVFVVLLTIFPNMMGDVTEDQPVFIMR